MDEVQNAPLTVERIVVAGVDLADAQGLAGLSIRKLAQRLGAGTMAAYRHVKSRDQLVELMVDHALGAHPAEVSAAADWKGGVSLWAAAMTDRYRRHPWLIDAPIAGVPTTPNRAAWMEAILQPLARTGLGLPDVLNSALLIDGHVRSVAYLVREIDRARSLPPAAIPAFDEQEFPMLSRVMASGELEDETEQQIDFGLARIVAGIELLSG